MIVEPKREILLGPLMRAGVRRSWAARDHFLRLSVLPLAVMVVILVPLQSALEQMMFGSDATSLPEDGGRTPMMALLLVAYVAALTVFAVNWLRQLTLGTSAVPGLGLSLGGRNIRFFLLMLATLFGTGVLAVILVFILSPFGLPGAGAAIMVSVLAWAVVVARLSPSWIGIAIDAPMPLGVAWRRTSGQGFKLLVALLAIDVPLMFVRQVVGGIFAGTGLLEAAPVTFTLLTAIIQLVGTAAQLAILATAFPHFLRETV
jgi:hypothetical protein